MARNQFLFEKSKMVIPGGVNSPVRAFGSVGGTPLFFERGKGATVWDSEGKAFVDYICSWGALVLGHANEKVVDAIIQAARTGSSFGAPTEAEFELAEIIVKTFNSIEQIRLVNSGTEATMSAVRLARGFTKRPKIIKFEGCYHGHVDSLLVKAGSGALTFGQPDSDGVPLGATADTLVLSYGNFEELENAFDRHGDDIAGVIIEPIAGNMNLIKPPENFLQFLRNLCDKFGSLLIFDEVMTGFRVGLQGVQGLMGVSPDLTALGKVIGGGLPMGAFGGRSDIMQKIAPAGPVYQAGTLSGNPIAVAAGLATLRQVVEPGFFDAISSFTEKLTKEIEKSGAKYNVDICAQAIGSMFGFYFAKSVPQNFSEAIALDKQKFRIFFHEMLAQGVYFAPSPFESGFTSISHGTKELSKTSKALDSAIHKVSSTV